MPTPGAVGGDVGYFTEGDPVGGTPATVVSADWANAVQEELMAVLTRAGLVGDKTSQTQLRDAIEAMITSGGSGVLSKTFANTPYTAAASGKIVKWDTSGGNCVQNLPAAAGVPGAIFTIVKTTADANTVTITPNGSEKINGDSTLVLDTQWSSARVMSIGTGYILVG
jgi:hypothetical protein